MIAKALAQVPEQLGPALALFGAVLGPSAIGPRPKEIVVLRTSALLGCRYCADAHTIVALDTGLTLEEVRTLRAEPGARAVRDAFPGVAEQALVAYIDAVAGGRGAVPDEIATAMAAHARDFEVVELTLLIATTMLLNRFCTALELPSSPETLARLKAEGLA